MKYLVYFFWLVHFAHANVLEAPLPSYDYQQNPYEMKWRNISTEHFDVIFPEDLEEDAQKAAHLLEKAYPYVSRSLEVLPPRIPLILQNQSLESNGFVTLAPRRSEFYITPSIDPELTNTEWIKTLSIHEFRHVVQFHKTRRGFNRVFEIILGQIGQALGLGLTLPPWFLEGDAVGIETALTRGGRGRLPLFDRNLRTLLLSGQNYNYDKAHLGSYKDYIPNHYYYGYFYTTWLRNEYGDLFLSKLADESAKRSYNPLTFYNAVDHLTNKKFEKFYKNVMKDLLTEWKNRADKLTPTPYSVKNDKNRFGWTNYYFPQVTNEGKIVALKRGLSFIERFVLLDGENEETLFFPAPLTAEYPYKLRNNRFAFVERELDPRWGYRDFSKIKIYDINKKIFTLVKGQTKARIAVLDQGGENLCFVEWRSKQEQFFVFLDAKGDEFLRIPFNKKEVITSIDWFNAREIVFVSKDQEDQKSISKINLDTQKVDLLLEKTSTNIGSVSVEEGHVFYESPQTGIDNIFILTHEGPRQVTSALFGAYSAELKDKKLIYNDYSASGMNIVEKSLPWDSEEKSEDSFYPIYEKFSKTENFKALESDYLEEKKYHSTKYSQVSHSINLHSWIILAPPLSNTVTLIGISRDVLNKFSFSVGGEYNLNERTASGFVSAAWTHLYPVLDLRGGFGSRRQDIYLGSNKKENRWEEGTIESGISIPWKYLQGRFIHSFTSRAFSRLIKVTNKISADKTEVNDGALFSPGFELSYSVSSRMAKRDINPPWAFFLAGRGEEGHDITGINQRGSLQNVEGKFFIPGLWHHHSFFHQLAYERQRDSFYQYSSLVLYPRGTSSIFLQELRKYSANYTLPLFYPDYNLSRYLYLKRISLNLFYDELVGRYYSLPYKAASAGWETIFEMNFLRIVIPLSVGVRGSYVLDGMKKENNYEIFLASVLGTF